MAGHSIFGRSESVTLATFSRHFFLHCNSQVATVCTFILHYPVQLLTLPLYPILIHYRNLPYLNKMPKYLFTLH